MNHLQTRLAERKINISMSELYEKASRCDVDTAIVIKKLDAIQNDSNKSFFSRQESNGDLVILIVRNQKPYTIMYRRSEQNMSPLSMRVKEVLYLC